MINDTFKRCRFWCQTDLEKNITDILQKLLFLKINIWMDRTKSENNITASPLHIYQLPQKMVLVKTGAHPSDINIWILEMGKLTLIYVEFQKHVTIYWSTSLCYNYKIIWGKVMVLAFDSHIWPAWIITVIPNLEKSTLVFMF